MTARLQHSGTQGSLASATLGAHWGAACPPLAPSSPSKAPVRMGHARQSESSQPHTHDWS